MLYFFCFCFCFWLSLIFLVACFGGVLLCFLIVVFTPNFVLFCTAFLLLPSFFFLLSALSSALVCILVFKACSFSCSATLFVKCSYNRVSTTTSDNAKNKPLMLQMGLPQMQDVLLHF